MSNEHKIFQKQLEESADRIDPGPETYESILRNVLTEAGAGEKTSYAMGKERVEQMLRRTRKRRATAFVSAGLMVVAAACFGLYLAPGGTTIPGDNLVIIDDELPPLAQLPQDAQLLVEMVSLEGDVLTLRLVGDLEAVDWQSLYGLDEAGEQHLPLAVDPDMGLVRFQRPDGDLTLHASDLEGNPLL